MYRTLQNRVWNSHATSEKRNDTRIRFQRKCAASKTNSSSYVFFAADWDFLNFPGESRRGRGSESRYSLGAEVKTESSRSNPVASAINHRSPPERSRSGSRSTLSRKTQKRGNNMRRGKGEKARRSAVSLIYTTVQSTRPPRDTVSTGASIEEPQGDCNLMNIVKVFLPPGGISVSLSETRRELTSSRRIERCITGDRSESYSRCCGARILNILALWILVQSVFLSVKLSFSLRFIG